MVRGRLAMWRWCGGEARTGVVMKAIGFGEGVEDGAGEEDEDGFGLTKAGVEAAQWEAVAAIVPEEVSWRNKESFGCETKKVQKY